MTLKKAENYELYNSSAKKSFLKGFNLGMIVIFIITVIAIYIFPTEKIIYYQFDREAYPLLSINNRTSDYNPYKYDIEFYTNLSLSTSCTGIEEFYTGLSYFDDIHSLYAAYHKVYNPDPTATYKMKTPKDIFYNSTGIDCEDFAHFAECLSRLYNVSCGFYFQETGGRMDGLNGGHLGVCCNITEGVICDDYLPYYP